MEKIDEITLDEVKKIIARIDEVLEAETNRVEEEGYPSLQDQIKEMLEKSFVKEKGYNPLLEFLLKDVCEYEQDAEIDKELEGFLLDRFVQLITLIVEYRGGCQNY